MPASRPHLSSYGYYVPGVPWPVKKSLSIAYKKLTLINSSVKNKL